MFDRIQESKQERQFVPWEGLLIRSGFSSAWIERNSFSDAKQQDNESETNCFSDCHISIDFNSLNH